MNREILFRGKRIDNGEWVRGYLIGDDVIVGEIIEFEDEYFYCEFWWKVDPKTVGQFTGFFDRYDSKIFQGDILQDNEYAAEEGVCEAVVEWDLEKGCWDTNPWGQLGDTFDGYEIIDNIHDNPDLLKGDL